MDPDETIRLMLEAFGEEDFDLAIESSSALLRWLRVGGFPPTVSVSVAGERIELTEEQSNRAVAYAVANEILVRGTSLTKPY